MVLFQCVGKAGLGEMLLQLFIYQFFSPGFVFSVHLYNAFCILRVDTLEMSHYHCEPQAQVEMCGVLRPWHGVWCMVMQYYTLKCVVKIISAGRCVKLLAFKHVTKTTHKTTSQKLI